MYRPRASHNARNTQETNKQQPNQKLYNIDCIDSSGAGRRRGVEYPLCRISNAIAIEPCVLRFLRGIYRKAARTGARSTHFWLLLPLRLLCQQPCGRCTLSTRYRSPSGAARTLVKTPRLEITLLLPSSSSATAALCFSKWLCYSSLVPGKHSQWRTRRSFDDKASRLEVSSQIA